MAFVKIAKLGTTTKEVVASPGSSIKSVLDANRVSYNATDDFTMNGAPATLNTPLREAAGREAIIVTINPAVKGGAQFLVKIARSGEVAREVLAEGGWTVGRVLSAAGYTSTGQVITINGMAANENTVLTGTEGLILLTAAVKGGK